MENSKKLKIELAYHPTSPLLGIYLEKNLVQKYICIPLFIAALLHGQDMGELLSQVPLCDPMDCSVPGSYVHGIFQARILEWVAISFSRGSFQPRD